MKILDYMQRYDYEQVVFCCDRGVGLRAIIAIHDTTLGPALGGARMWPYPSEEEAVLDALRLGRAMTYKASAAGLHMGGGKVVIMGDPAKDKSEGLLRSLGRFVQSLGGRYITTEDVGMYAHDMEAVRTETSYVVGLPTFLGGSGDPSPATAVGLRHGIKACLKEVFGSEALRGRTVAIQGVGKVGSSLAQLLHEEGAKLIVADIVEERAQRMKKEFGATLVEPKAIYDVECDIFSPCALGAILNDDTIPRLRCKMVAGSANNQLAEDRHGLELYKRGILYAPDYIINAGGIINLSLELEEAGYDPEAAQAKLANIYCTMEEVIAIAKGKEITTAQAADRLAEERIEKARRRKPIYLEG